MASSNSRSRFKILLWACILVVVVAGITKLWPAVDPAKAYETGIKAARKSDFETVQQTIDQIADNTEFVAHRAMLQGFIELGKGNNDIALQLFSKGQLHPDTREESYLQAGQICYRLKEFREAVQLLAQVTEWNPDHVQAHRLLAASFYDIGAMDQALDEITHVIRLAPDDHRPHFMKASILQDYEQFQVAVAVFEEASQLCDANSPPDVAVRSGWSECLLRLGRYDEALAVVKNLPPSPVIEVKKAEAFYFLRQYDQASALVEKLLPDYSNDVGLVTVAIRLFEYSGEYDRGIELITAALENDPQNIRLQSSAADIFGAAGKLDKAREYRELAARTGELQQRFSQLHQVAVKEVNNAALRLELAQVAEKLGKLRIAITWFQAAIGMAPDDESIQSEWTRFQQDHVEIFRNSGGLPR